MIKALFFNIFLFIGVIFADDSLFAAISKYYSLREDFRPCLDRYNEESPKSGSFGEKEQQLKNKLYEFYGNCMAGKFFNKWKDFVQSSSFHCGEAVDFYPNKPREIALKKVVDNNRSLAHVGYGIIEINIYSSILDFSLDNGEHLKHLFDFYKISNVSYRQAFNDIHKYEQETDWTGEYSLRIISEVIAVFFLTKTNAGWRINDMENAYENSILLISYNK